MSYEFYKIIHFIGIVMILTGLTGLLTIKMSGGALEGTSKKLVFMAHGFGLLFVLVSGFGLLARLGLTQSMPGWVFGKLAIWLIFGGIIALLKRKAQIGTPLYFLLLAIFTAAAYLAVVKPF
jgi:hypothetical protein